MRLIDATILRKPTAARAPFVFTVHTRNALFSEMIDPFQNDILRFVCTSVVENGELFIIGKPDQTSNDPSKVCLSIPSKHSSKYGSQL